MGIKERKQKHKEDLKQNILIAAKKLFLEDGYEATSIRKIAAEIEFSPTTIYLYYKDKHEIAHALHQEGFKIMGKSFGVLAHVEHPFERLKAMGRLYLQFALENPDFYELMFVMKEPMEHIQNNCGWEEGEEVFDTLVQTIKACQDVGYFKQFDSNVFALLVWSTVHGLCALKINNHLDFMVADKKILENVGDGLSQAFEVYVQTLERLK